MSRWTQLKSALQARSSTRRLFHVAGPDTAKSHRPIVVLVSQGMTGCQECWLLKPSGPDANVSHNLLLYRTDHETMDETWAHHCDMETKQQSHAVETPHITSSGQVSQGHLGQQGYGVCTNRYFGIKKVFCWLTDYLEKGNRPYPRLWFELCLTVLHVINLSMYVCM